MAREVERRSCRRFEIPGGKVRYKKSGLSALFKGFTKAYPLLNVSKGGLAFECEASFNWGEKITVQLLVPELSPLNLHSIIRRQGDSRDGYPVIGVGFMPFGPRKGWNTHEALEELRGLEARYALKKV